MVQKRVRKKGARLGCDPGRADAHGERLEMRTVWPLNTFLQAKRQASSGPAKRPIEQPPTSHSGPTHSVVKRGAYSPGPSPRWPSSGSHPRHLYGIRYYSLCTGDIHAGRAAGPRHRTPWVYALYGSPAPLG